MPTILIVEPDVARSRHLVALSRAISSHVQIEHFVAPEPALAWAQRHSTDLVLANSLLTEMDAFNLIRRFRQLPDGEHLPLVMMTPWSNREVRRQVLEAGATDLLAMPVDDLEFHARCTNLITQRRQHRLIHERACWLEKKVAEATSEIRRREQETLLRLAKAGEYRDEDTGNHVIRMARYSRLIAEQLGLSPDECDAIEIAAPMHDIGKIGIPDEILLKPGRLTHREFEIMKTHTTIGYDILKDSPSKYLQMGAVIAHSHHEKYNGTGYPNQLGGQEIPLAARIVSVADAYDALTSERPYKPRWSKQKALDYINEQRGRFFDPVCLDAFLTRLDSITEVQSALDDRQASGHSLTAFLTAYRCEGVEEPVAAGRTQWKTVPT